MMALAVSGFHQQHPTHLSATEGYRKVAWDVEQQDERKYTHPTATPFIDPFKYNTATRSVFASTTLKATRSPTLMQKTAFNKGMSTNNNHIGINTTRPSIKGRRTYAVPDAIVTLPQQPKPIHLPSLPRECVVSTVACILESISKKEHRIEAPITIFQSAFLPEMTMDAYVCRLTKFTRCSELALIMAVILMSRASDSHQVFVSELTIHRLFLMALRISTKCYDDDYYDNRLFARTGGVEKVSEFNFMESEFLRIINYNTHVTVQQYRSDCTYLGTQQFHTAGCVCMRQKYNEIDIGKDLNDHIPKCEDTDDTFLFPIPDDKLSLVHPPSATREIHRSSGLEVLDDAAASAAVTAVSSALSSAAILPVTIDASSTSTEATTVTKTILLTKAYTSAEAMLSQEATEVPHDH